MRNVDLVVLIYLRADSLLTLSKAKRAELFALTAVRPTPYAGLWRLPLCERVLYPRTHEF